MDTPKSREDIYALLCTQLVRSDPLGVYQKRDLHKDIETVMSRYRSEGLSFLTKTLPKLGKALDKALVSQRLSVPREFKCSHKNRSIPAFLQAYFSLLFDSDGQLLERVNAEVIKHLRQILFFVYKLELPYSQDIIDSVLERFISVDRELELSQDSEFLEILEEASRITELVFRDLDPKDIVPKHGPGAVATGERLEEKWEFSRLYQAIHQMYPYYKYYVVGGARELIDRRGWYFSLQRLETGVAKVVLVPKDSRGPRLISEEPLEYQWIQQGLGRKLAAHLEEGNPLTAGRVNFTRQDINRNLAMAASRSGRLATVDLQDASDRVSVELVERVFKRTPRLLAHLLACRTTATQMPNGTVVELRKFAPMGSALCFPVEAYIFWVLIVAAITSFTRVPLRVASRDVYVYGDDIIVPTSMYNACKQVLTFAGLKVNEDKSCFTGSFRESCGMDAYNGYDVTPLKLRTLWSGRPTDASAYVSYVSYANDLALRGYSEASETIWGLVEDTYGKVPYGTSSSSFPCRLAKSVADAVTRNRSICRYRFSTDLQRVEFYVKRIVPRRRNSKLDGWERLLRNLVSSVPVSTIEIDRRPADKWIKDLLISMDPSVVVEPRSTRIKRGWASIYPPVG